MGDLVFVICVIVVSIMPFLLLSLPAFVTLKKRNALKFHDFGLFFYGFFLCAFVGIMTMSIDIGITKGIANFIVEPAIMSLCITIITYINIIQPKKIISLKISCVIALIIAILLVFVPGLGN